MLETLSLKAPDNHHILVHEAAPLDKAIPSQFPVGLPARAAKDHLLCHFLLPKLSLWLLSTAAINNLDHMDRLVNLVNLVRLVQFPVEDPRDLLHPTQDQLRPSPRSPLPSRLHHVNGLARFSSSTQTHPVE